jgi:hypothetical protein
MQIETGVTVLPTVDVDQLVSDVSSAPTGTVLVLSSDDVTALLTEIKNVAHEVLSSFPLWTVGNASGGPMQYQRLHDLYAALGGTDTFTLTGTA